MSKAPAFQFYTGDWKKDVELHMMSFQSRGLWIEMLMCMWDANERGKLEGTEVQLCRMLGCTSEEFQTALRDLSVTKTANVTNCNGIVTVINRRMYREENERKSTRLRVGRYRDTEKKRKCNALVTVPSSSSSSSSNKESIKKDKIQLIENHFQTIPDALMEKWREVAPGINIQDEIKKAELWLLAHPEKRRSRWGAFLSNWMVRAQDHFIKYGGNGNGRTNTNLNDKRSSIQDEIDAGVAKATAIYNTHKAARSNPGGISGNNDAPDFSRG